MPEICGAFYKKYPQVGVTVDVGNTGGLQQLLEKLKKGALDLVLGYDYDENEFEGIPLHNERLIFVIHKDTQGAAVLKKICSYTRRNFVKKFFDGKGAGGLFGIPGCKICQKPGNLKCVPKNASNAW